MITSTGPRGLVVAQNATTLAQQLDQASTTMYLAADVFDDSDLVTLGTEDVLITSAGTTCSVTRGQNGTQDVTHVQGANVRSAVGVELASHTFDGATYLSALRCGGEVEAMYAVEINGALKYVALTTPYQLEVFFPLARYQPADQCNIKIYVWSWVPEAVFWAQMQS